MVASQAVQIVHEGLIAMAAGFMQPCVVAVTCKLCSHWQFILMQTPFSHHVHCILYRVLVKISGHDNIFCLKKGAMGREIPTARRVLVRLG